MVGARRSLAALVVAVGVGLTALWPATSGAQTKGSGTDATSCKGAIQSARYAQPVTRYGHDVLGGKGEWGQLSVQHRNDGPCRYGSSGLTLALPETLVFEDLAPRVVDLDGDGFNEVVTVESALTRGARLTVWGNNGEGAARRLASTPYIGTRNRWLAPFPPADLDGDGRLELAYIDRPHLAKTLRIWRYDGEGLSEIASLPGLTNHRIGWDYITGGVRDCGAGVEIVTASGDWSRLIAVRLTGTRLDTRDLGAWSAEAEARALSCG